MKCLRHVFPVNDGVSATLNSNTFDELGTGHGPYNGILCPGFKEICRPSTWINARDTPGNLEAN